IAAVNGPAVGAGLALACACDVRIASDTATFCSGFVKRSLVPDTGMAYTLPRIVGTGVAREMVLTGRPYDSASAQGAGLVDRRRPPAEVMPAAMAMAEDIAGNPPIAVRSTKTLMDSLWSDLGTIIYTERFANRPSVGTKDRIEAAQSFREKRKPV